LTRCPDWGLLVQTTLGSISLQELTDAVRYLMKGPAKKVLKEEVEKINVVPPGEEAAWYLSAELPYSTVAFGEHQGLAGSYNPILKQINILPLRTKDYSYTALELLSHEVGHAGVDRMLDLLSKKLARTSEFPGLSMRRLWEELKKGGTPHVRPEEGLEPSDQSKYLRLQLFRSENSVAQNAWRNKTVGFLGKLFGEGGEDIILATEAVQRQKRCL